MIVLDASTVVAAVSDQGNDGAWAKALLASERDLAAPHLMPVEVAHYLRRSAGSGLLSDDAASIAHALLMRLPVELFPYEAFAGRVWDLRRVVTAYDAWYVALAEALGAPLVTLDAKLARAAGPRCEFVTPPSAR